MKGWVGAGGGGGGRAEEEEKEGRGRRRNRSQDGAQRRNKMMERGNVRWLVRRMAVEMAEDEGGKLREAVGGEGR